MNLKQIKIISDTILDLSDFVQGNCDGDESGIYDRMMDNIEEANKVIDDARYKIYLRNALAKAKRDKIKALKPQ